MSDEVESVYDSTLRELEVTYGIGERLRASTINALLLVARVVLILHKDAVKETVDV